MVVEELLKDAVTSERAGHLALQTVRERAHAAQDAAALADLNWRRRQPGRTPAACPAATSRSCCGTWWRPSTPLPPRAARAAGPGPSGYTLAGLLRCEVEATAPAARHLVFDFDFAAAAGLRGRLDLAAADGPPGRPRASRAAAGDALDRPG